MHNENGFQLNTLLKGVPLFRNLDDSQLVELYEAGSVKKFLKGEVIVYQHDPGDTFYTVISGCVKVTLLYENSREFILTILKNGDFFGELSIFDNEPRSATVIVLEDTEVFLLTQGQFYQLLTAHPDICKKVIKQICTRLRRSNEKIGSLAFLDVYGRTLKMLLQLAHDQGIKTGKGIEILFAPTHEELSSMVGASPEAVTKIIKELKENRTLISYTGRKVVLRENIDCPLM